MFFRSFLYRHLPNPGTLFDRLGTTGFTCAYARWHSSSHLCLVKWHRCRLEEIDVDFRFSNANNALMAARSHARDEGIGPADPRYPVLGDFIKIPTIK